MSLCHLRLPRLILAQCSQQVLIQLQWLWNREYIWIHQSINSDVKTSYVIVTWFELFQIRELPAHPRERESMKRQQSVEVQEKNKTLYICYKEWLWKLLLERTHTNLTEDWQHLIRPSLVSFPGGALQREVGTFVDNDFLLLLVFFFGSNCQLSINSKWLPKNTTTYNITFVLYPSFWIKNWMLAYKNF